MTHDSQHRPRNSNADRLELHAPPDATETPLNRQKSNRLPQPPRTIGTCLDLRATHYPVATWQKGSPIPHSAIRNWIPP
ncbi:MAG: hypothetical protein AMXMBFR82_00880 [Candidatus Hydrogenedentota bacterium]